jgi:predicted transcriptional regulator
MINKRRSEIGILGEILKLAQEGIKKTHIQYKANLSFSQLQTFLKFTVDKGLLKEVQRNPFHGYKTTEKGLELLSLIKEMKNYLGGEEGER